MNIIIDFIFLLIRILKWFIIIECIMSWFPGARMSKAYEFITMFTEPILSPIRNILYRYIDIPIDLSPIIAFFLLDFGMRLLVSVLYRM